MPTYEVSLPDQMEDKIDRVVAEGDFINREQAIEELLTRGISVYQETSSTDDDGFEETFGGGYDERHDPARDDDMDDGRTF
jgi:Arc/MetJ-type ribon-helix-helix transcriptional regulator